MDLSLLLRKMPKEKGKVGFSIANEFLSMVDMWQRLYEFN